METLLVGDVADATVLIIDDLISSGGTMARAARACRDGGARVVYAFAAHGLFTGDAADVLRHSDLAKTFITDTVPAFRIDEDLIAARVEILSVAPLFAEAILALHEGGSINTLLEGSD